MSDLVFEEIDECEIVGRVRGSGKQKLPKWEPILSWNRPALPDSYWLWNGYRLTERDYKVMAETKRESLRKQNEEVDKQIELLGIRSKNVRVVRNQKEVRIKL